MCVFRGFPKRRGNNEANGDMCVDFVTYKGVDPDPELREYLGVSWPLVMTLLPAGFQSEMEHLEIFVDCRIIVRVQLGFF